MTHPPQESPRHYEWFRAKSLLPRKSQCERGLTGALIPNSDGKNDHIAVVYDEGDLPPKDYNQADLGISSHRYGE